MLGSKCAKQYIRRASKRFVNLDGPFYLNEILNLFIFKVSTSRHHIGSHACYYPQTWLPPWLTTHLVRCLLCVRMNQRCTTVVQTDNILWNPIKPPPKNTQSSAHEHVLPFPHHLCSASSIHSAPATTLLSDWYIGIISRSRSELNPSNLGAYRGQRTDSAVTSATRWTWESSIVEWSKLWNADCDNARWLRGIDHVVSYHLIFRDGHAMLIINAMLLFNQWHFHSMSVREKYCLQLHYRAFMNGVADAVTVTRTAHRRRPEEEARTLLVLTRMPSEHLIWLPGLLKWWQSVRRGRDAHLTNDQNRVRNTGNRLYTSHTLSPVRPMRHWEEWRPDYPWKVEPESNSSTLLQSLFTVVPHGTRTGSAPTRPSRTRWSCW